MLFVLIVAGTALALFVASLLVIDRENAVTRVCGSKVIKPPVRSRGFWFEGTENADRPKHSWSLDVGLHQTNVLD